MNRLAAWFSELSPRERRLVTIFGGIIAVFLVLLVPVGLSVMISTRRQENTDLREVLQRVQASKAVVKARQARREQVVARYAKRAPKLGGFLEQLAKDEKLQIPEAQDRPEVPIGKRYVERATQIRLQKVGGLPLLRFLEKIEQSGYPLAISRLNIRKRGSEKNSFDAEVVISAYDRNDVPAAPAPATSAEGK